MDSVSSASQSMMEYISGPAVTRGPPPPLHSGAAAVRVVDLSGVALTVPYKIRLGIRCRTDKDVTAVRQRAVDVINATFAEAERVFSPFCPTSELEHHINHNKSTDCIAVSPAMHDVLMICDDLVRWSRGAFDPSCVAAGRRAVQAIKQQVRTYLSEVAASEGHPPGVDAASLQRLHSSSWFPPPPPKDDGSPPSAMTVAVQRAMAHVRATEALQGLHDTVGWIRLVEVGSDGWVRKQHPDVHIDVSAVSKGWTVDMLCSRLGQELAVYDLYVDWGGDIRAVGHHDEDDSTTAAPRRRPWMAGVMAPPTAGSEASGTPTSDAVVAFPEEGGTLCTSGDYFQWQHLVDAWDPVPSSATPSYDVASVTMLLKGAPCALCDGLTTAVFLLLRRHPQDDVVRWLCERFPVDAIGKLMVVVRNHAVPDGGGGDGGNVCIDLTSAVEACHHRLQAAGSGLLIGTTDDATHSEGRRLSERFRRRLSFSNGALHRAGGNPTASPCSAASCPWFWHRPASLDTSVLRSIGRSIPRCVCIVLFPVARRGLFPSDSPHPNPTDRHQMADELFGIAVTSLVQLSLTQVVAFVERGTAAATLMERKAERSSAVNHVSDARGSVFYVAVLAPHTLHRTQEGGVDLIASFSSGRFLSDGLQDRVLDDCYYVGAYTYSSTAVAGDLGSWCGDHAPVLGTWTRHARSRHQQQHCEGGGGALGGFDAAQWLPTESQTAGPTPTNDRPALAMLLRVRQKFLTAAIPPRNRWHGIPRCQCVATVAHASSTSGAVHVCLGTVLVGLDTTSRQPPLWTAYARPGPLHTLLFGDRAHTATLGDGDAACCVLRLHLFPHGSSEGEALVDWFKDVACVDPRQQFVYHAAPSRNLTPIAMPATAVPSDGAAAPRRWVHDYTFVGSIATVDVVLVRAVPVGNDGFVLVLSPTQCTNIAKPTEPLDDTTTLSYTFS